LISRWRISDSVHHDVSVDGCEPRAAIETTIETPHGSLHVVAAHLGLSFSERAHQAALLSQVAQTGPSHSVLLGDFNDLLRHGSVQQALGHTLPNRTHHKTFPAWWPVLALDRIYCRPADLLLHSWTDPRAWRASDHLPIIADLDMRGAEEMAGEGATRRAASPPVSSPPIHAGADLP
jgi:endonuclease/exonuclease/phosphatase family metal-dependent hydrolase